MTGFESRVGLQYGPVAQRRSGLLIRAWRRFDSGLDHFHVCRGKHPNGQEPGRYPGTAATPPTRFDSAASRHMPRAGCTPEGILLEQSLVLKTGLRGSNPRPSANPID